MRDPLGREVDYLRISITDRCNLRCLYCMPEAGVEPRPHEEILRYEELQRLVLVAAGLGFRHFRVTGGEPLLRRGAAGFVARLASWPEIEDLALTTNGTLLGPVAAELRRAGLKRVNVSLDTLRPERFALLARRDLWAAAWAGLQAAIELGYDPLKLNVVLMRGFNEDELVAFADLSLELPLHVRFIELMPLGCGVQVGGFLGAPEAMERLLASPGAELLRLGPGAAPVGAGPAVTYRWRGGRGTVGFITALSAKFCAACNRLRLTADGKLSPCLASEVEFDLRDPLRAGANDDELRRLFQLAVEAKPACHLMEQDLPGDGSRRRRMSRLGG